MCQCHAHVCCDGCHGSIDRRRFLQGAAAMTVGGLTSLGRILTLMLRDGSERSSRRLGKAVETWISSR